MKRLLAVMLLSSTALVVFSVLCWAATTASVGPATKTNITISLSSATLADGIDALFVGSGLNYAIDPALKSRKVIMTLNGVTFEEALRVIVKAADVTYTVEDGVYIFAPIKPKEDIVKSTNKFTIHQAVKPIEEVKTDQANVQTDLAAQSTTVPEQPQQDPLPVLYQAVDAYMQQQMNMNQGFYQPQNIQLGNMTIMNGGYDQYTPPFTIGGSGYNTNFVSPYQSPMGWQPYNQFQTPFGMQRPYNMVW